MWPISDASPLLGYTPVSSTFIHLHHFYPLGESTYAQHNTQYPLITNEGTY